MQELEERAAPKGRVPGPACCGSEDAQGGEVGYRSPQGGSSAPPALDNIRECTSAGVEKRRYERVGD